MTSDTATATGLGQKADISRLTASVGGPVDSPTARVGPHDHASVEEVLALLPTLATWSSWTRGKRSLTSRGAESILRWLAGHPGAGWQQRWVAANADVDTGWLATMPANTAGRNAAARRSLLQHGLAGLLLCRVVLPGYGFLAVYKPTRLLTEVRRTTQPELFARTAAYAAEIGMVEHRAQLGLNVISKLVLHTGLPVERFSHAEFDEFHRWALGRGNKMPTGLIQAWDLLRGVGVLPRNSSYRAMRRQGPRPTVELVDRYRVRHGPVRDVLVRYLDERRPSLDYNTFVGIVSVLAGTFWADIETHHPEIDSLDLPENVAAEWKERLRFVTYRHAEPRRRRNYIEILIQVRSFYLDIQEWALNDPSWAPHAVPSPVRRAETQGLAKERRRAIATVHQRIRERLPQLPVLIETAEQHRTHQQTLLSLAKNTSIGDQFTHHGILYRRTVYKTYLQQPHRELPDVVLVENPKDGQTIDLAKTEDEAFWAWAVVETLRHTGVRLEELLEISHLALVSYQLPETDELVPLLHIVPSKTDQERLLLISPELASVLATVISRLRVINGGTIPLISQYDPYERTFGPALPLLFQRRIGHRNEAISKSSVQALLNATLARCGLCDATGNPLRFTPHDFRRIFATDAVTGGLPVHIVSRLLGHKSVASVEPYLAVFQDDLINTYRGFLDQRRSLRPETEYCEPTDEEWREFQDHFALRKLELGTCGRPYGTPCKHEHACIRCPMLRVDPKALPRLTEIARNLSDRITEARMNGWLGEVQGLQTSLEAAKRKLASAERMERSAPNTPTDLGLPSINERPRRA